MARRGRGTDNSVSLHGTRERSPGTAAKRERRKCGIMNKPTRATNDAARAAHNAARATNEDPSTAIRERAERAYKKVLPELRRLRPRELNTVNLEIAAAVATALRVHSRIVELAPRISRELPEFELRRVKRL